MGAVVIGDSMIKYVDRHIPGVDILSNPGACIGDLLLVFKENNLLNDQTKLFLIHAGTNDISKPDVPVSTCLAKMKELCSSIQQHCPHATVAISSVIFRKIGLYLN